MNLVDEGLFCRNSRTTPLNSSILNLSCVELIIKDSNYISNSGLNTCIKIIDCLSPRFTICEWRGNTIQSYNLELTSQLINSYISLLFVIALFCFMWTMLYFLHIIRIRNENSSAISDYLEELKIFNLSTREDKQL